MENACGLELSARHLPRRDQAFTWRYWENARTISQDSQSSGPELKFVFPKDETNKLITHS